MDRETIEAILRSVSYGCREEVEAALDEPAEISTACKQEIKTALAAHSQATFETPPRATRQSGGDQKVLGASMLDIVTVNNALLVAACAIGVAIVYFGTGRLNSKRHKAGKKKTKPKQK